MRGLTHLILANNPLLSDRGAVGGGSSGAEAEDQTTDSPPPHSLSGLRLLDRLLSLDLSATAVSTRTLQCGIAAPDLRQLSLNQCSRVEDGGLYRLAARHPRLERLELRSCPLSDTGLVSGLSCLPRLVFLDLGSCMYISSTGIALPFYGVTTNTTTE
jgi:hypothetical protein